MSLPLVPAISQWDGGPHEHQNCTCASAARLLWYGTGIRASGSSVRSRQSDQSGGTSIPDVMRALHNGWSCEPFWAAPNDSNSGVNPSIPANHQGGFVTEIHLRNLLAQGYMVLTQGDYGNLPILYREQKNFLGDHAFTIDTYNSAKAYYVVDTLPKPGSGYNGRWVPAAALRSYWFGLAGNGKIYAAWIKPPASWRIAIRPVAHQKRRYYFTYAVSGDRITARVRHASAGLSASCTPPEGGFTTTLDITVPDQLVRVTSGVLSGDWVDAKFATKQ